MLDDAIERWIEAIETSIRRLGAVVAPHTRPLDVAAFALIALLAPLFTWAHGFHGAYCGVTYTGGLIAALAAFELLVVCALRLAGVIGRKMYLWFAVVFAFAVAAAPAWFWVTTIGTEDTRTGNLLLGLFDPVRLTAGFGLYASMLAALGAIASLLFDVLVPPKSPRPRQLNWPIAGTVVLSQTAES